VELKPFAAVPRLTSEWDLRIDSDSVFVRHVHLTRYVQDLLAQGPFTLVHNLVNGSCRGWPLAPNTSNEFLHMADARRFGYALSSFWLFETAAYARFAARVRASYSFKELVAWIDARDGLDKGVNNLLMTDAYYRYLLNEDPRRHAYRSVEDDAVRRVRLQDTLEQAACRCEFVRRGRGADRRRIPCAEWPSADVGDTRRLRHAGAHSVQRGHHQGDAEYLSCYDHVGLSGHPSAGLSHPSCAHGGWGELGRNRS